MKALRTTSPELLARVRCSEDSDAWRTFFDLYAPLLYRFARSLGLPGADAAEVRDQCLLELARTLPRWCYDPARGRFKSWLHALVRARAADAHRRRRRTPSSLELAGAAEPFVLEHLADDWDRQWRAEHLRHCCEQARRLVSARTYRAFELLAVHGATVPQVAAELGLNENQVYKAKSRVLAEVRRCMARFGEPVD